MKKILLFFIVLFISVWIGIKITDDPGYVLIAYQHWTIEMPLWLAIIAVLISFMVISIVFRVICYVFSINQRLYTWSSQYQLRKVTAYTRKGLINLAEGYWQMAEKHLSKAITKRDTSLIYYLAAAKAAHEQGEIEHCDHYLRVAQNTFPSEELAIGLTQAKCQIANRQWEEALAILCHLYSHYNKHPVILKLLCRVDVQLQDWVHLVILLPTLWRYKILTEAELLTLEQDVYSGILRKTVEDNGLASLHEVWSGFPHRAQKIPAIVAVYVRYLLADNRHQEAETCLRATLKKHWDESLVILYGLTQGERSNRQLATAEAWLTHQPNNAVLFLTLGRLSLHEQLWGKARQYLESSLKLNASTEAYAELAKLLGQLGEQNAALDCYRQGLTAAIKYPYY